MKYEKEFLASTTKGEFVKRVLHNNKQLKSQSAERRYYELKQVFTNKTRPTQKRLISVPLIYNNIEFDKNDIKPINAIKRLMIEDMRKYGTKITRTILKKYGFVDSEINYLLTNNMIILAEDY